MTQKKITTFNIWKCLVCDEHPIFQHEGMMAHLKEVHGIDTKTTKASQTLLSHMDAQDWFQNDYEYEVNGMKFINSRRSERAADDMMRFV